jgi:hypothetical protein
VTFQEEDDEMNVQEIIELAERTCGAVGRLGEDVKMATDDVLNDPDQSSPVGREHGELIRVVAELLELAGGLARPGSITGVPATSPCATRSPRMGDGCLSCTPAGARATK